MGYLLLGNNIRVRSADSILNLHLWKQRTNDEDVEELFIRDGEYNEHRGKGEKHNCQTTRVVTVS